MPRLVVRKSFLSTTHFCRSSILGNSAKTPQRKTNVEVDEDDVVCHHLPPTPQPPPQPPQPQPPQPKGEKAAAAGARAARLIAGGVRLLLRRCRLCSRARCVFIIIAVVLFFTFALLRFTEDDDDPAARAARGKTRASKANHPRQQIAVSLESRNYRLSPPNCTALIDGDRREIGQVETMLYKETRQPYPSYYFTGLTRNCSRYRILRRYPAIPESAYEVNHPVVYVVGVKEHAEEVERLIRATYAPQNFYCLYSINSTTSPFVSDDLVLALRQISACFSNVIVTTGGRASQRRPPKVPYEVCLKAMLAYPGWQYVLMIAEGDFPLKPNRRIVDSVRRLASMWRAKRRSDDERLLPPLTRHNDYSGYMITRKMAALATRGLADYSLAELDDVSESRLLTEMPEFVKLKIRFNKFCHDDTKCALRSSDLQWLVYQPFLFARNFDLKTDHVIVSCLERKLERQRLTQDTSYY